MSDNEKFVRDVPLMGAGGLYYFTLEAEQDGPVHGLFSITNSREWSGETIGHIEIPISIE